MRSVLSVRTSVCACVYVRAVTFESSDLETSFWVWGITSRSSSQEQERRILA